MSTHAQDLLATARRLGEQDEPYALVSVLRVQPPAAAKPGDKAIVTRDGFVDGWIGGGCAQPAVLRTVQQALEDGQARLVRVAPDGEGQPLDDVLQFGMSCPSGGTLELFVDPVLPRARLTVIGDSPVAQALAGLAPRVGFAVSIVAQGATAEAWPEAQQVLAGDCPHATPKKVAPGSFVVVATQGKRDVQGLRCALALGGRGVWLVASERKAGVLKQSLITAGSDAAAVAAIVAPAGTPIGARTPEEVALSVLAAVVAARRQGSALTNLGPRAEAAANAPQAPSASTVAMPAASAAGGSCCGGSAAAVTPSAPEPALVQAVPVAAPTSCCGGA